MSISVSVNVKPSRQLSMMMHAFCILIAASGLMVGIGLLGDWPLKQRIFIAAASVICPLFALLHYRRQQRYYRIAISDSGTIRLAVYAESQFSEGASWDAVCLLDRSTLWSGMMLLRLQSESGRVHVLRILPDAVSQHEFRALSVALRWIAARVEEPLDAVSTAVD